jgi:hypothetical protein
MKLVLIPAGEFIMGSPRDEKKRGDDEGPQHRVRITKPFYLGIYEVTRAEYGLSFLPLLQPGIAADRDDPHRQVTITAGSRVSMASGMGVELRYESEQEKAVKRRSAVFGGKRGYRFRRVVQASAFSSRRRKLARVKSSGWPSEV